MFWFILRVVLLVIPITKLFLKQARFNSFKGYLRLLKVLKGFYHKAFQ
jgi:hypothetical protein